MCFYVFLISSNYSITAIWGQNCFHGFCDSPKGQSAATAQPAARWFLQEAAACESTPEDADLFYVPPPDISAGAMCGGGRNYCCKRTSFSGSFGII